MVTRRHWLLYDLALSLTDVDGQTLDKVTSCAGLREIAVINGKHCLNGAPIYLRGVLDQGYFPEDGTAPPMIRFCARM